jgi:hypothetical protein
MSLGANKAALMAAASGAEANYFGDGSLGDCQFGASSITQSGDSVAIDTVLTIGSESGGPGSNVYGSENTDLTEVVNTDATYGLTALNNSGAYDADMWVGNFTNLTIDADVTLTTHQPCRGMLIYCSGNAVINGALSMQSRGALGDPTASGGSDSSAVNANGIQLGLFHASVTDTLAANTFDGCGNAAVAAVANQPAIDSNGILLSIVRAGAALGTKCGGSWTCDACGCNGNGGGAASGDETKTLQTGGGGGGGVGINTTGGEGQGGYGGDGAAGTCFSGGSGGGGGSVCYGCSGVAGGAAVANGGAGGDADPDTNTGLKYATAGAGNPAGTSGYSADDSNSGTGGIIFLIVKGDITFGSAGAAYVRGADAEFGGGYTGGGGSSGGGAAFICHGGTLTVTGSLSGRTASSGVISGGGGGVGGSHPGGTGGGGTSFATQILT